MPGVNAAARRAILGETWQILTATLIKLFNFLFLEFNGIR
jgi:hypothetical protein